MFHLLARIDGSIMKRREALVEGQQQQTELVTA
jgi:hypothetical protein